VAVDASGDVVVHHKGQQPREEQHEKNPPRVRQGQERHRPARSPAGPLVAAADTVTVVVVVVVVLVLLLPGAEVRSRVVAQYEAVLVPALAVLEVPQGVVLFGHGGVHGALAGLAHPQVRAAGQGRQACQVPRVRVHARLVASEQDQQQNQQCDDQAYDAYERESRRHGDAQGQGAPVDLAHGAGAVDLEAEGFRR